MIIYLIEDINDLKYVGKTKNKLTIRMTGHRANKKNDKRCSSAKLNLDYCIIYQLEECSEDLAKEREQYWINKIDCVNIFKLNFNRKEYDKKTRERRNELQRQRRKLKKQQSKLKSKQ